MAKATLRTRARWIAGFIALGSVAAAIELACDSSSSSSGNECVHNLVFVKDIKEANPLASGQTECAADTDCTFRYGGDSCGCPYFNDTIDKTRAAIFDEKMNAITCQSTCERPCDGGIIPLKTGCIDNRCVFVDASCNFNACKDDGGELVDAEPSSDAAADVIDASIDAD